MAVDVNIGSVETVIEATDGSSSRQALIAEVVQAVKAELDRERLAEERRARDTVGPRAGRRP
ncbi:MAG TPA: hypothetical protein PKE40_03055 [Arachnia sp.]|nr:hypothetical protein [Arachnia sp.]HMT85308.1 hypothetical protein [Arachnia sp.]